jgi:segregation and condensation protein B
MSASRSRMGTTDAEGDISEAMALGSAVRIAEALLFAAREPLAEEVMQSALPNGVPLRDVLAHLVPHYAARGVNLVQVGGRWTFRTAPDLAFLLAKNVEEPRRLSRAAMETLAIIAYHQPVTRAEIEDIRGVATAKGTLDVLMEATWVRMRGRRKTPGRPITFGTTETFLQQFSLNAVSDLPGLDELKQAGMLDARLPAGLSMPLPSDDPALRDDEDPLEMAAEERINMLDAPLETGEEPELEDEGEGSNDDDRLDPLADERR